MHLKNRFMLLALAALLVVPACNPARHVPMVLRPDTRAIGHLIIETETVATMVGLFRAAYPNEAALCLTGAVRDTVVDGSSWLLVNVTDAGLAQADSVDPYHVFFPRVPRTGCAGPVVGIAHDHIYSPPSEPCTHSLPDALVLFNETRALVSIVFCGDGRSEVLFQDGRRAGSHWFSQ